MTLILLAVGSMWVSLLVMQARQESLQYHSNQQKLSAVDYNVFRSDENSRHSNTIRNVVVVGQNKDNSSTVHRLAQTNGRLPKGLDIGLPALSQKSNSTRQHITSPSSSHNTSPSEAATTRLQPSSETHNSSSPPAHKTAAAAADTKRKQHHVTLDSLPSQNGPDSIQILRDRLVRANEEQRVLNADCFPELAPDGVILVVQVHRREGYLQQLFNSMRKVRGIEKVLLVISHDYFYDDIMKLVKTVDFCRVSVTSALATISVYHIFSMS